MLGVLLVETMVDGGADQERRRERGRRRRSSERDRGERRPRPVGPGEPVERRQAPPRRRPRPVVDDDLRAARRACSRAARPPALAAPRATSAARPRRDFGLLLGDRALEPAVLVDLAVDLARGEHLVVGCRGRRPGRGRGRRSRRRGRSSRARWAMITVVRPRIASRRPSADPRLGRGVDRGGRVVEDQDPRIDDERARDREPLALAARERDRRARRSPSRSPRGSRSMNSCACASRAASLDLLVGRLRAAEGEVVADGGREEERILRDHADLAAQRGRA